MCISIKRHKGWTNRASATGAIKTICLYYKVAGEVPDNYIVDYLMGLESAPEHLIDYFYKTLSESSPEAYEFFLRASGVKNRMQ